MKVVEFRLPMPMTCEQYKICQLYMIAKASLEDSGYGEGMRILLNTTYEEEGLIGQYTHKRISLASKIPSWLTSFVDSRFVVFDEKSWNGFPRLRTVYESDVFPKIQISVLSFHSEGFNTLDNAAELPEHLLKIRKIVDIDIVNDRISPKDYNPAEDPRLYSCEGVGPFGADWKTSTSPIMTCYKVFVLDVPYFGLLSSRIENWAMNTMKDQLFGYHRRACCWMHEWNSLSMDDIRVMEDDVKAKLDSMWSDEGTVEPNKEYDRERNFSSPSEEETAGISRENLPTEVEGNEIQASPKPDDELMEFSCPIDRIETTSGSTNLNSNLAHTGYLYKLGDGFLNTAWNPRYVVVKDGRLLYFNDPRDSRPKDSVDLANSQIRWVGELRDRTHSFVVQPLGRRPLHFSGDSVEGTKQWLLWLQLSAEGEFLRNFTPEELSAVQPSPPPKTMTRETSENRGSILESESGVRMGREDVSGIGMVTKTNETEPFLNEACKGGDFTLISSHNNVRISLKDIGSWSCIKPNMIEKTKGSLYKGDFLVMIIKLLVFICMFVTTLEFLLFLVDYILSVILQNIFYVFVLRSTFTPWGTNRHSHVVILKFVILSFISYLFYYFFYSMKSQNNNNNNRKLKTAKVTCIVPISAIEVFAYLMDNTTTATQWRVGLKNSLKLSQINSQNDCIAEYFTPIPLLFSNTYNLLNQFCQLFLQVRRFVFLRIWEILPDGSYCVVYNNDLSNNYNKPLNTEPFTPVKGYELFLITPITTKTSAVTYITALDLQGSLPNFLHELTTLQRAASFAAFRDAVIFSRLPSTLLTSQLLAGKEGRQGGKGESLDAKPELTPLPSNAPEAFHMKSDSLNMEGFSRVRSGGLRLTDQQLIDKQKGVVLELIKSGSKALWGGKGIVGISLPVRIFEPKSLLQRLALGWGLGPKYLTKAAIETDPLERFKLCIAFVVGSLHSGCSASKPFNPILGETFHSSWPDGTELHFEHTSHHPPITHYCVIGPDELYRLYGFFEFKGQFKGNYALATQDGPSRFCTADGNIIEWKWPTIKLSGLIWGSRTFDWVNKMEFSDPKNDLQSTIHLAPLETKLLSGRNSQPTDHLQGSITKGDKNICNISGNWLEEILFDDKQYWAMDEQPVKPTEIPLSQALPSDSRRRADLVYLDIGNEAEAQTWKLKLEAKQRKEKQMRQDYRKEQGIPEPCCT